MESAQLVQQKCNRGLFEKAKDAAQSLMSKKEEIEFIEINKDNLNFQISSNESTEVEIIFAESEINMQHMEGILNCISNFKGLTNNDAIKPLIKINCDHPVAESQDKLNICPFFAKKTVNQETVLCLTTTQNDVELVSSILEITQASLRLNIKKMNIHFLAII